MHSGVFAMALGFMAVALAQQASTNSPTLPPVPRNASRPGLLFREDWRAPAHEGAPNDENMRVTPAVVGNPRLELKLYGRDAQAVLAAEHEGRIDLWTGLTAAPVAVTLRDKNNYVDMTGLARLRWIVRTTAIHTLYPVVKLADGSLLVGNRGVSTDGEFIQVEVAFGGMRWYKLDPAKVVVTSEVKNPDLSRVDELGFSSLAPAGGHGIAGSANLSTVELYANAVPR
jgi:hypothetical protein